ncbi:unnamed protein product [Cochlearia groenlandica]
MGELPPIVKILKKVQKRKDGTYVSSRSEKIVNAYEARLAGRVAPKTKKHRTFGVGSIETVPAASSSQTRRTAQDHAEENVRLREQLAEQEVRYQNITDFFSIITMESPNLARLMQRRGVQPTQPPVIPSDVAATAAQDL